MKKNGFTLIETIIYIAIIGGIIASFTNFSLSISSLKNKNFVIQETQVNSRIAINMITNYIKKADAVLSPAKGETSGFLVLDMPEPEENITIQLYDERLYLKQGTSDPIHLVSDLIRTDTLQFSNIAAEKSSDSIRIDLTNSYKHDASMEFKYSYPLITTVSLRK